jgi:hypothetical protein
MNQIPNNVRQVTSIGKCEAHRFTVRRSEGKLVVQENDCDDLETRVFNLIMNMDSPNHPSNNEIVSVLREV